MPGWKSLKKKKKKRVPPCFNFKRVIPAEKEIKKIILFIIASKGIKYLGTDFTKQVKDLYTHQKL